MADVSKRVSENAEGEFFVDSTCIDCDTCRQIAPSVFRDHGGASSVYAQPATAEEEERASMALVACPTASIGKLGDRDLSRAVARFPSQVHGEVYFCGFTSASSFGAWSYLIARPAERGGNVLVDSPRFNRPLARKIAAMGGITTMFLTHRDDVADHLKFAREFGCTRIMHAADGAARLGIERVIRGYEPERIDRDLVAIPTPGHTRGHMVLLYHEKFLFTGDHLSWSPTRQTLRASRSTSWYSWQEQTRSMVKLLDYSFEWVLPGHGRIHHDTQEVMRGHLERCVDWMKKTP